MPDRALVLGGGGLAGIAWETGLLVGLADAGIDVFNVDLIVGTSAGSNVAAQISSGMLLEYLFRRQVDPALQAREIAVQADFQRIIAEYVRNAEAGGSSTEILRRLGALAMLASTSGEAERREVILTRLPSHRWPEARLLIRSNHQVHAFRSG